MLHKLRFETESPKDVPPPRAQNEPPNSFAHDTERGVEKQPFRRRRLNAFFGEA